MGRAFFMALNPALSGTVARPPTRGPFNVNGMGALSRQALATDPVGVFSLTLDGLVIGSAIQVQSQSGVALLNIVCDTTTEVLNLQAYAPGSALNNLRIKVRKGSSAPFYQPFETLITSFVGSASVFVSQISDE